MPGILVNGIVAQRDKQPYIQIMRDDGMMVAQLTMAQARSIAQDILVMASRTEADAMLWRFWEKSELPTGGAQALMLVIPRVQKRTGRRESGQDRGEPRCRMTISRCSPSREVRR
jgi:hypothetical protein